MAYTNSPMVVYTKLSPNHSGQRTHSIDRITPHCVVGQLSAESICGCFTSTSRQASCNYGIGKDGRVSLCVEEKNRSWCSSSAANDQRAITIECASDLNHPYAMNSAVYASLINLCTDICKRNGKTKLLWLGDKNKTLNYAPAANEMVITCHRWYDDEDGGAAEFYMAVETAAAPISNLVSNLQPTFRRWIEHLEVGTDERPLTGLIDPQGKVLDFNYTEFVETLYGKNDCESAGTECER